MKAKPYDGPQKRKPEQIFVKLIEPPAPNRHSYCLVYI